MKISKVLLFILLLFVGFGYAQNKLTGKVVNSKSKPVANAKIYLDSIYSNVTTNSMGEFEVLLPEKVSTINVYSTQYGLLSSKLNNEDIMNFMFLESDKSMKERTKKGDKITIGYSKENQKYQVLNSESIGVEKDKNTAIYNTIYDLIRGRLAGVTVSRDNRITIRGVSSVRNISDPLFVVDGMIVSSIDYISPNNVKNISVLKGADAATYGAQGSSGVILITTK
ncbi:TonB-dependent receptor plug domain-containing protein [Flavobacterium sp. XS2P12]|jgi:TonB-dependent SusC/RagA subfamily outer membrane receptor|uniref:TonB-dependent receptor plug domain-containing protein n=1 Tax=Flavobacterium melibiosi TaxID=3398734 RepID=UPI003A8B4847